MLRFAAAGRAPRDVLSVVHSCRVLRVDALQRAADAASRIPGAPRPTPVTVYRCVPASRPRRPDAARLMDPGLIWRPGDFSFFALLERPPASRAIQRRFASSTPQTPNSTKTVGGNATTSSPPTSQQQGAAAAPTKSGATPPASASSTPVSSTPPSFAKDAVRASTTGTAQAAAKQGTAAAAATAASGGSNPASPASAPRPPLVLAERRVTPQAVAELMRKGALMLAQAPKKVTLAVGRALWQLLTEPRATTRHVWHVVKEGAEHYWLGSKLLVADVRIAKKLVKRMLHGHRLTRRERKQLLRTASDMARLVPFLVFVIVPFMEFLLPVFLKIFPNMLPSTFQSADEKQANMQAKMKLRMDMTSFMQEAMVEMAHKAQHKDGAQGLMVALDKARSGASIGNDVVIELAKLFKDDITLDNVSHTQLVTMCRYMGISVFGSDTFLRYQLRSKVRQLKNDDQLILWEGIEELDLDELKQACADRGMRATGLTKSGYRAQLAQWLELSVNKHVPISLLIMSRAFTMSRSTEDVEEALGASISAMEPGVVNEAVLEAAADDDLETRRRKLESIKYQEQLMSGEQQATQTQQPAPSDLPHGSGAVAPKPPQEAK